MRAYANIPSLADFLLEESHVLDLVAHPASLTLVVDLILIIDHAEYHEPVPGEQF